MVLDRKREQTNFALPHDIRVAFIIGWSKRVMSAVLKELMRLTHVETSTATCGARKEWAATDAVWNAMAKSFPLVGGNRNCAECAELTESWNR